MIRITNQLILPLCFAALLSACSSTSRNESGLLAAPAKRINDETVLADHKAFSALRVRHEELNKAGNPLSSYGMAKAQCWQDVAFHEYTRNDRSAFPELALRESVRLMDAISAKQTVPQDTPLLDGAVKLREDLWERASKLKGHKGFECVSDKVACAEVRLSHAGHEFVQAGGFRQEGSWRYANPYVRIAEDSLGRAEREAEACSPPAVVAAIPVPERRVVTEVTSIPIIVLFNYNKADASNIRTFSREALDSAIARIKRGEFSIRSIVVTGYADRLNRTGQADYNDRLAASRAVTVTEILTQGGIDSALIKTSSRGDAIQVETCAKLTAEAEVRECLLPNRRVEVQITSERVISK
jgi:outer membrane protein OmpA-like peptidoglycan-associated protein